MRFLIDAYNVIGQSDHIQLKDPNKVSAFVGWLIRNRRQKDHFSVVFDGQNKWMGFPTTEKRSGLVIIHTAIDRSADQYIKDKLEQLTDKSAITVVTSDRDIQLFAKKRQVKCIDATAFIRYINHQNEQENEKNLPPITEQHVEGWLKEFGQSGD